VPDIGIDTHFMERNRIPRLVQFLASGACRKGIGISEDTSIFIYPNNRLEVVGSGAVVMINAEKMSYTNYQEIAMNAIISTSKLRFSFLSHTSMFDLKKWDVIQTREELMEGLEAVQETAGG
jgi:cyanophycinase